MCAPTDSNPLTIDPTLLGARCRSGICGDGYENSSPPNFREFARDPERWQEFKKRYRLELKESPRAELFQALVNRAAQGNVTLIFSTHDTEQNNAVVLQEEIEKLGSKKAKAGRGSHGV